jgi:transcriptional regulator with XRE-family HTH domain/tetratricopeptide (TPR) repeat protein
MRRPELARLRRLAGLTQEALAERLGVAQQSVARWERGEFKPLLMLRPGLAELLGITVAELDDLLDEPDDHRSSGDTRGSLADWSDAGEAAPQRRNVDHAGLDAPSHDLPGLGPTNRNDMHRRDLMRLAGSLGVLGAAPPSGVPDAESEHIVRALGGPRLGDDALEMLDTQVQSLAASYFTSAFGHVARRAGAVRRIALALLRGTASLAEQRCLTAFAGKLSVLLGMTSFDQGEFSTASRHLEAASELAREAGDRGLAAQVHRRRSYGALHQGRPSDAVSLARAGLAMQVAEQQLPLLTLEARARARMGDHAGARDTLGLIAAAEDRASIHRPRTTVFGYDIAQHVHCLGTTHLWLGDYTRADTYARQALGLFDGDYPAVSNRESARLDTAFAMLGTGEVEEAARVGQRSLEGEGRGIIIDLRVRELDDALAKHRGLAAVDDLHELVTTHDPVTA